MIFFPPALNSISLEVGKGEPLGRLIKKAKRLRLTYILISYEKERSVLLKKGDRPIRTEKLL
jgi:hypothetical protein